MFIAVVPHSYLTHYQCSPQACFEQCSSVRYTIVHSYLEYNTMRLKRIQVKSFKTIISLQHTLIWKKPDGVVISIVYSNWHV